MISPKISIIMPIHNTPIDYLKACVNSIFLQSFHDWELICVDDNSTQADTINELKRIENHEQVSVIWSNESLGAAKARNLGFQKSKGSFVIFLDSDDIFDINLLGILYDAAVGANADMAICGFEMFDSGTGEIIAHRPISHHRDECEKDEFYLCRDTGNPWDRLCKRDFLEKYQINFQDLSCNNDVSYFYMTYILADKIAYVNDKCLVKYRTNSKSQISLNRDPINVYYALMYIEKRMEELGYLSPDMKSIIDATYLCNTLGELMRAKNADKCKHAYYYCRKYFKNHKGFKHKDLNVRLKYLLKYDYETKWFELVGKYKLQLDITKQELIKELAPYNSDDILLWGVGKRGQAFLKWAMENRVCIEHIYDRKNAGGIDENNIVINFQCIVASNSNIYNFLTNKKTSIKIINLEKYCEL